MRTLFSILLVCVFATSAAAQVTPELPRTQPTIEFTFVDGAVKMDRSFVQATRMAYMLAGAMQAAPATVTVLGVGSIGFSVAVPTLADATAQGYRAYVGTAATGIALAVTCSGTASPFQCKAPLTNISSQLSATAQALALTAFVSAADGDLETAKSIAPFVLRLAGPPVGPTAAATSILPK